MDARGALDGVGGLEIIEALDETAKKMLNRRAVGVKSQTVFLMFQRFSLFAFLLCALALNSSHVAGAKDSAAQSADRKAIVAAYGAMDRAVVKKDTDAMMKLIAPDFVAHSQDLGVFDRAAFERVWRLMEASDTSVIYSNSKITKFQWRGPDAVVWASSKSRMHSKRGTLMTWEDTRHYWGKINGKWQLRQEVTLAYKSLLNGKPLR